MYEIVPGTFINPRDIDFFKVSSDNSLQVAYGSRVLRFGPFSDDELRNIINDLCDLYNEYSFYSGD